MAAEHFYRFQQRDLSEVPLTGQTSMASKVDIYSVQCLRVSPGRSVWLYNPTSSHGISRASIHSWYYLWFRRVHKERRRELKRTTTSFCKT